MLTPPLSGLRCAVAHRAELTRKRMKNPEPKPKPVFARGGGGGEGEGGDGVLRFGVQSVKGHCSPPPPWTARAHAQPSTSPPPPLPWTAAHAAHALMMTSMRRNQRTSATVCVTICTSVPVARKPLRKYRDFHLFFLSVCVWMHYWFVD